MKFEDRSHEETERQQRCARSKAWDLAKNIYNLKANDKATFFSPAEKWRVLLAASTKELEEREFVVDSGASMHMVSKRDLNSAELETMRTSRSPTTVMTVNGEVQTREESTVYVKELDLLVTVVLLEETPAVLSLGKLCEDHGYTYHWTCGQKPHLTTNGKRIDAEEPMRKPKVIYTDDSLEFGKSCEDLSWNHCTSTLLRSETNGIAERAVRRVKEGTSAVLLQSGLDENWWADSMECYTYLRNIEDLLSDGKTPYERRFGIPSNGPVIPFGAMVEYHPISAKDQSRT